MYSNHHPDFSSSEDDLEDDFEFQELIREQRKRRIEEYNKMASQQTKQQRQKNFHVLLMNGKISDVISELENGLDVNERLPNNWSPILVAASTANYELVKELQNRGADLNVTRDGDSILMLACNCPKTTTPYEESVKVVKLLLDSGVNPKSINRKRMNALMCAASNGNLEAVKLLFPVSDIKAEDNQNWNALFWAVNSGNIELVEFLANEGLQLDRIDIRGNSILDIARNNDFNEILDMLNYEEEPEEFLDIQYKTDFEDNFKDLKDGERPQFLQDICKILYGTHCENLIKLFAEKNVNLFDLLSSTERDFELLGVEMPFQRKRLMAGIHKFHLHPFHPSSVPTVHKGDLYSNMDLAVAILSVIKQLIAMEASLRFIIKNSDDNKKISQDIEIRKITHNIRNKLEGFNTVVNKLSDKADDWDLQLKPPNLITSKSGKRWFPWRKTMFAFGILFIVSVKVWNKSASVKI